MRAFKLALNKAEGDANAAGIPSGVR